MLQTFNIKAEEFNSFGFILSS